jgi:hypothetical protein
MDLLTTYKHDSKLQVITVPPLISTNLKITKALDKNFLACYIFTSCYQATASNSVDSSASCAQALSSQTPYKSLKLRNFYGFDDNRMNVSVSCAFNILIQSLLRVNTSRQLDRKQKTINLPKSDKDLQHPLSLHPISHLST